MKSKLILIIATAAILMCSGAIAKQKKAGSAGLPIFAQDKGKFTIQLNGQTVGHEDFDLSPSGGGWATHSTTELKALDAPAARVTGALTLQPDGAPISYQWTSQTEKTNGAHILFANGVAKMTLEMQGARPFEQDLSFGTSLIAVLDNNIYYQYAVLARVYDWSKRGAQSFPVLIPQDLTPGSITIESIGTSNAAGKSYDGVRVTTSDLEVLLYLDPNHRLMRLEVPSAKVSVFRE
jgi:hypothetical protein